MSHKVVTIYAVAERTASGKIIIDIKPEEFIPTYSGLSKVVRNHIDFDKLIKLDNFNHEMEIGTVSYDNTKTKIDSSDIKVKSIDYTVKKHCSI